MAQASPVPVRRTQEERTALSDRLLVGAAIALLIERGIGGTTLIAIGERAGYSRGLVTHRFGSKAGLLAHVHDTVASHWIERVQSRVGGAVGVEALQRVVDALYEFIAEAPDEIRAMYLLRYASIDPAAEYRANVAKFHKAQRRDAQRWDRGWPSHRRAACRHRSVHRRGALLRDCRRARVPVVGQS